MNLSLWIAFVGIGFIAGLASVVAFFGIRQLRVRSIREKKAALKRRHLLRTGFLGTAPSATMEKGYPSYTIKQFQKKAF